MDRTLGGSFLFGTIAGYRPKDEAQIGRFSDFQEGFQRDVFRSRSGIYNANIEGTTLKGVSINGFENPVVVEFEVNDYCSCSSRGEFDITRARLIRDRGNPDINAYAVYDLEILVSAISEILTETDSRQHLKVIARDVEYGVKDRHWEIEDHVKIESSKDHMAVWLGNAFVKSPDYAHEDELRMLLIDPDQPGQLKGDVEPVILDDPRIAAAIVAHGYF